MPLQQSNRYTFRTHWRVAAPVELVYRVLEYTPGLVRWWPSVWLKVEELDPGDANALGSVYRLTSKGWLPYTLRWTMTTTEKAFPTRLALAASGDFAGQGLWTLAQEGPIAAVTYDWSIVADKPLLKYGSPFLKPIFRANHEWAMRRGEESLRLELLRRQAITDAERDAVPPPPKPTFLGSRKRRRLGLE